jgi:imidazolonepropionase-like amidohydrolase
MKSKLLVVCCLVMGAVFGQKSQAILLVNGFLHQGNGTVVETALIGIRNGKIDFVKNALSSAYKKSEWDTIIDLQGQHVYPAFIAPNSTLGITEIDAVRATRDFQEVGYLNPHIRSQIAFNAESKVISTVRTNGVLFAQVTPRGGRISGTSSVMALSGWNWEDATIFKDDGVHINWPESIQGTWKDDVITKTKGKNYQQQKEELVTFFNLVKAYQNNADELKTDLRLNAMIPCLTAEKRIYFHANEIQQLTDIIEFVHFFDIPYPVIVGGYDSYMIARKLKDAKIPVMLGRTHSLPENEDDPIDLPFQLPTMLQKEGVLFCLQNEGEMEAMNARNLPFQAGTAMAYGLTEEQAIQSISLNTAKIMGISKTYGSIEAGKSASLFVSKGNALDMRTNQVSLIFVNGSFVPTTNFQTELYQRYEKKYQAIKQY